MAEDVLERHQERLGDAAIECITDDFYDTMEAGPEPAGGWTCAALADVYDDRVGMDWDGGYTWGAQECIGVHHRSDSDDMPVIQQVSDDLRAADPAAAAAAANTAAVHATAVANAKAVAVDVAREAARRLGMRP